MRRGEALLGTLLVTGGIGCSALLGLDGLTKRSATDAGPNPDAVGATTASKVDLLVVVDDSSSMADKALLLGKFIGVLLRRMGSAGDLHVGVISTSLGTMGGDLCPETSRANALAHLRTTARDGATVPGAAQGFLAFGGGAPTDLDKLVAEAELLVNGVGEMGCGVEAQLESAYRFLVQPDPWSQVTVDRTSQARLEGIDRVLLEQRRAFLRPDSLVVVLMLTDEDDSSADPRSVGGQGWFFMANQVPGSSTFRADGRSTTAPRATSTCAADPASPDCTSCGFAATCNPAETACQKLKNDPECLKNGGFYGPTEDPLNVRFHRMKERFGIDPQFPISRYVNGFTKQRVPDRDGEHAAGDAGVVSEYVGTESCTNPLFAAALPSGSDDAELCALEKGPRGKELVVFAVIGGVPEALVGGDPQWTRILGRDPASYDPSEQDPHMVQSITPRNGLSVATSTRGDNGGDAIHGREWDTSGNDLQYACTFPLETPRTCTAQDPSCDCADPSTNPPLCGSTLGLQVRAKAYPSIRELRVAKELGDRGVVGSICPTDVVDYRSTMNRLADRLDKRITK